jgi:hypothetical protein
LRSLADDGISVGAVCFQKNIVFILFQQTLNNGKKQTFTIANEKYLTFAMVKRKQ